MLCSRVVIISAVRSQERWLKIDALSGKGLIHEPKRFNVAMTRAKELLIVVGNPQILTVSPSLPLPWRLSQFLIRPKNEQLDPWWLSFYRFCVRNKCYTGTPIERHQSETSGAEGISRLEEVYRLKRGGGGDDLDLLVGRMAREMLKEQDD